MNSELDQTLAHELAYIGMEDNFDWLERGDYPGAWREDVDPEDIEELSLWQREFLAEKATPQELSGITLNGSPVVGAYWE